MLQKYLNLIKFSHTIFALPFAIVGFILGVLQNDIDFNYTLFFKVILCMVFARSAAMSFNRYLDRDVDGLNPRTKTREIPSGILSEKNVLSFTIINCLLFIAATYLINPICFYLSPVALMIILGYSYTKRFTSFCHFVLGLGLSLAPVGAFLAVTGYFDVLPILLGTSVLFWVSGFDIIYALQDEEFDQRNNLKSLPVALGKRGALILSRILHFCSIIFLILFAYQGILEFEELSYVFMAGTLIFIGLLIYQHFIVSEKDLSRVGLAFFTLNGYASLTFGSLFIADVFFL